MKKIMSALALTLLLSAGHLYSMDAGKNALAALPTQAQTLLTDPANWKTAGIALAVCVAYHRYGDRLSIIPGAGPIIAHSNSGGLRAEVAGLRADITALRGEIAALHTAPVAASTDGAGE